MAKKNKKNKAPALEAPEPLIQPQVLGRGKGSISKLTGAGTKVQSSAGLYTDIEKLDKSTNPKTPTAPRANPTPRKKSKAVKNPTPGDPSKGRGIIPPGTPPPSNQNRLQQPPKTPATRTPNPTKPSPIPTVPTKPSVPKSGPTLPPPIDRPNQTPKPTMPRPPSSGPIALPNTPPPAGANTGIIKPKTNVTPVPRLPAQGSSPVLNSQGNPMSQQKIAKKQAKAAAGKPLQSAKAMGRVK